MRWLWLVYVPLGFFALGLPLVLLNLLNGVASWVVVLLAIYCVVPARLVLEARMKGVGLPKPPGEVKSKLANKSSVPARAARGAGDRPGAAAARHTAATRGRHSGKIMRRRMLAGMIGLGLLMSIGALLVILGIDAMRSSVGIFMLGLGAFMIVVSVTIPAFRLIDATLRAVGRMLKHQPTARR